MAEMQDRADVLQVEMDTYGKNRSSLLGEHEGKYVLIYGEEIGGVFVAKSDAISQGYAKYGNVPFLVKHILSVDVPLHFVSGLLAI